MKTKITIAVLLALAVLTSLGLLTAAADGSTSVAYLDNQSHQLAANASILSRFDYAVDNNTGTRPITTITLVNGTNSGVGFQVWTPDTVGNMTDNKPIGQGTSAAVDCTTGTISGSGTCLSPDLTWSGAFGAPNTYYVLVTNSNNSSASYSLKIQGTGVSLGQQTASALGAPAAAPVLAATNMDDPAKAVAIDAKQHSVPANSAVWYSFKYGILNDGTRPVQTITLVNGNQAGLGFQIYAPDGSMMGGWWNNDPTGQGTAASTDCNTGVVAGQGACASNNLTWSGAFAMNGTYYVRVVNSTNAPMNFTLTIQ